MTLTVPCLFGLEAPVADEMRRLGLRNVRAENGRVHCDGTLADIARLNINLRCGARVLLELGSFPRAGFRVPLPGELPPCPGKTISPKTEEFPREGLVPELHPPLRPRLPGHCEKRPLPSGWAMPTAARRCRRPAPATRSSSPSSRTEPRSIWTPPARGSTSGATGPGTWAPPLKETLAAALVTLSRYRGKDPFCDPFCGSGTIPIEAALIAKNRAPGLDRSFSAQRWKNMDAKLWMDAADEAMDKEFHGTYDIWGGDIDPAAVELAKTQRISRGRGGLYPL